MFMATKKPRMNMEAVGQRDNGVMARVSRSFQIFSKPVGAICNLGCRYCYYLKREDPCAEDHSIRMPYDILERYIVQHIHASRGSVIRFSWHGGEPTIPGPGYYRTILEIQQRHRPPGKRIANGIQTNGTLLTEEWCRFLAKEGFSVGLSLDGPQEIHDKYRLTKDGRPTHKKAMQGYRLLQQQGMTPDILCVINAHNVQYPDEVYDFFREIGARYIGFLPLVEPEAENGVSPSTVPAEAFGRFLCTVFDAWRDRDIGRIKVQLFEEAVKTTFDEEHELCIFRRTCGDIPVIEYNGDIFCCDHFVDPGHHLGNIQETPLVQLLESPDLIAFGRIKSDTLPHYCLDCEYLAMCNGECPKNRFIRDLDGEKGLNYLCAGYKRFFNHIQPFLKGLEGLRHSQSRRMDRVEAQVRTKTGRNDPCPCGSGKKYKKCCLGK
jgi:uncharacterized protein